MLPQQRLISSLNGFTFNTQFLRFRMSKDRVAPKVVCDDAGDSRYTSPRVSTRSAVDRTWHPSHGITFHPPSKSKPWRISQGTVLLERSKCQSIADSKSPGSKKASPFSMSSNKLPSPASTVLELEAKNQQYLDLASNSADHIRQPVSVSNTLEMLYEPPIRPSKSLYVDDPPSEELALMALNLHTPTCRISMPSYKTNCDISNYESRLYRRVIKGYNRLRHFIDIISDDTSSHLSAVNACLVDLRLGMKIERENILQFIYFFLLFLKHRRKSKAPFQLSEEIRAASLRGIRYAIMNDKVKMPFCRYAASQLELYSVQSMVGYRPRQKHLPRGTKERVKTIASAARRLGENSNCSGFLEEKQSLYNGSSKQGLLFAALSRSFDQLQMLSKQLRTLWKEYRILSPVAKPLDPTGSKKSELICAVFRTRKKLAGVWPMLRMNRPIMNRSWKQSLQPNCAGFSTMADANGRGYVVNSQVETGLNLQPKQRQAHRYIPSSQLPRRGELVNEINQTLELKASAKNTSRDLHSDHEFYNSPSLPIYTSRPAEPIYSTLSKASIDNVRNNLGAKTNVSGNYDKSCNDQADQDTAEDWQNLIRYQIPRAKMQEITLASLEGKPTHWQYTLYQGPGGEKVKIHYCKSIETTERVAKLFLNQEVVGFDIEWKPQASANEGIKKNVALIQLASEERIALFHIALFAKDNLEDLVAPTLQEIMESPSITKVGVSIKADCTRLRRFMGINSRGLFELSHLYKLIKYAAGDVTKINKLLVSLACQVEEHLRLPLWKGAVRNSDWSKQLDYEQIQYAASDSYAGFQLYHTLENKRKALSPMPPRPAHAELGLPIRWVADGQTVATYNESMETSDDSYLAGPCDSSLSTEELARDFLNVSLEDPLKSLLKTTTIPGETATAMTAAEFTAANEWVLQWRKTLPLSYKPRAFPAQLRAYALWHEMHQSIIAAAAILRDPPLKASTVAAYVLEALKLERLPFNKERIMDVVQYIPESSRARYGTFLKKHGIERIE